MSRDFLAPTQVHRSAVAEAQGAISDVLGDCRGADARREALIAHLSVGSGLLSHEIGAKGAAAVLRNILRALEGLSS